MIHQFLNLKCLNKKKEQEVIGKGPGDIVDDKIWFESTNDLNPSEFVGYDHNYSESEIKKIIVNNTIKNHISYGEAVIILNQTPFLW